MLKWKAIRRRRRRRRRKGVSETICFRPQVREGGDTYSVGSIRKS
jgi:hypothetical protein